MMEEAQLERYSFFQYCGVFGVDRANPRVGMRAVAYAAELLQKRSQRVVWIFPQGEITPNDHRPLSTYAGAAHIAKRVVAAHGSVRCIPMAIRLEFMGEQRPEALLRLGPAHVVMGQVDAAKLHDDMDQRLEHEMDALHADVISGATTEYQTIFRGRPSVNVVWDQVRSLLGVR
jgi:1-acyl-sn-glycerol-3-phosphate acyltransferase